MNKIIQRVKNRYDYLLYKYKRYNSPIFQYPGALEYKNFGHPCFKNKKIGVVGLPKSGNTWLVTLLADVLDMQFTDYSAKNQGGICMWHVPLKDGVYRKKDVAHIVYILRDVRDVICSHYYYSQTDDYRRNMDASCYYDSFERFYFEYFLPRILDRYDWLNHTMDYAAACIPIIRYDYLWENTENELKRLFKIWGISEQVSESKTIDAIENNKIDKLKINGKMIFRKVPKTHFRRGGVRNFETEMPDKVLQDANIRFYSLLKDWGYDI